MSNPSPPRNISSEISFSSPSSLLSPETATVIKEVSGTMLEWTWVRRADGSPEGGRLEFPEMGEFGKVSEIASVLTQQRIVDLLVEYGIPSCRVMVPGPEDRACAPPVGFCTVYRASLKAGLRFPLHGAFREFLEKAQLPLGQLTPNSFRQLVCLGVEAYRNGVPMVSDLVFRYFSLKQSNGWFAVSPRAGPGPKAKVPNKLSGWHKEYFFCEAAEVPYMTWRKKITADIQVGPLDFDAAIRDVGKVDAVYSEETLISAGLSTRVKPFTVSARRQPRPEKKKRVRQDVDASSSKKTRSETGPERMLESGPSQPQQMNPSQGADSGVKSVVGVGLILPTLPETNIVDLTGGVKSPVITNEQRARIVQEWQGRYGPLLVGSGAELKETSDETPDVISQVQLRIAK